jgi:hypothetical protein
MTPEEFASRARGMTSAGRKRGIDVLAGKFIEIEIEPVER